MAKPYLIRWSSGGETLCADEQSVDIELSKISVVFVRDREKHFTVVYKNYHDYEHMEPPFAVVWPWK
jgi:hypothetical protein